MSEHLYKISGSKKKKSGEDFRAQVTDWSEIEHPHIVLKLHSSNCALGLDESVLQFTLHMPSSNQPMMRSWLLVFHECGNRRSLMKCSLTVHEGLIYPEVGHGLIYVH